MVWKIKVNSALKMYVLECFDVTAAHKKAMNGFSFIEECWSMTIRRAILNN